MSVVERLTGLPLRDNTPIALVGMGHGATHWIAATFYLLIPSLSTALNLDYAAAGLLVSILHIAAFLANFGSGPVTDMSGRRVLLQVVALLGGAVALAFLGVAGGLIGLGFLVAVIGVTNNLWHPPAISYLSGRFPGQRGWALSVHALGASLGDAVAPLAAGALLVAFTWQETAAISAMPVVVVALVLAISLGRAAPADAAGRGGGSKMAGGDYLAGLKTVIANKDVLSLCLMSSFRSMTQNGLMVFLPLYLANELKVSPLWMGGAIAALQFGGVVATPIAGRLSDKIGRRPVVLGGLSLSTIALVVLTGLGSEVMFIVGVSVLGFALFAVRPVVHSWLMDMTPPELGGSATSLMFGAQTGLSILAPVLGGIIADAYGLTATFYALAGTVLIANLLALRLPAGPVRAG